MNLAVEMAPHGVQVNSVSPSTTETAEFPTHLPEDQRLRRLREKPPGRIATPDGMADTIVLLCTTGARSITGADLVVSGGGLIAL